MELIELLARFEYNHTPDENSGIFPSDEAGKYWLSCSMGDTIIESPKSLEELREEYRSYFQLVSVGMDEEQQDLLGQAKDETCRMCLDELAPIYDRETGMCYSCWLWSTSD